MAEASRSIAPVHATDIIYSTICGEDPPADAEAGAAEEETEAQEGSGESGDGQQDQRLQGEAVQRRQGGPDFVLHQPVHRERRRPEDEDVEHEEDEMAMF